MEVKVIPCFPDLKANKTSRFLFFFVFFKNKAVVSATVGRYRPSDRLSGMTDDKVFALRRIQAAKLSYTLPFGQRVTELLSL